MIFVIAYFEVKALKKSIIPKILDYFFSLFNFANLDFFSKKKYRHLCIYTGCFVKATPIVFLQDFKILAGPKALSVASQTADPVVASLILARSYSFVDFDHEIIYMVIFLLRLIQEGLLSATSESICTKLDQKKVVR